jgi:hypothetical protein
MGYDSTFRGEFKLNKSLTVKDYKFLKNFSETRRMKRNLPEEYGVEGEFYVEGKGYGGQDRNDPSIINFNSPPSTQPGLWCQWIPNEEGDAIVWDGGEKFYNYVEWIQYLIDKILSPRGYILNGEVFWQGEDSDDEGKIVVKDNIVETKTVQKTYI